MIIILYVLKLSDNFKSNNGFVLKYIPCQMHKIDFSKLIPQKNKFTYKDRAARLMILPTRAKRT